MTLYLLIIMPYSRRDVAHIIYHNHLKFWGTNALNILLLSGQRDES